MTVCAASAQPSRRRAPPPPRSNNLLYPREDRTHHKLKFACRNCQFEVRGPCRTAASPALLTSAAAQMDATDYKVFTNDLKALGRCVQHGAAELHRCERRV